MVNPRERDQFARIELFQKIDKARQLIRQYEVGMAHWRKEIEQHMRTVGRLDERLGEGVE